MPDLDKSAPSSHALDYARHLFDNYTDWYKSADAKAQVLITLNGGFLAFLTSSAFAKGDDLQKLTSRFGIETWILLALMCIALTISIISAICCLWSRTYSTRHLRSKLRGLEVSPGCKHYPPQVMWFFQLVRELNPETFINQLLTIDDQFATRVLGAQVVELSKTVSQKHRWINIGFLFASAGLIIFVAAMISYVVRVAKHA